MKTLQNIMAAVLLIACCACQPKNGLPMSAVVATDSLGLSQDDSYGRYLLAMDFPQETAIAEWISEQLGGTYEGDYNDGKALIAHCFNNIRNEYAEEVKEWLEAFPGETANYYYEGHFKKGFETEHIVTYEHFTDVYTGGAHGSYLVDGQTFRKSDGRRIGWEILSNSYNDELQQMMKNGLMEYFQVTTDEELAECFLESNVYLIPLPECPPLFTADGILFQYQQYEIAAYAYGLPGFTIPYERIRPLLNITGRRLLPTA